MNPKSCLIIAGEKSGEEHTLSFFGALKEKNPGVHFFGVGGDLLKAQGVETIYHINQFSSMGFSEVLFKIPFYFRAMKRLESECQKRNTKTAILVDFQDFNLRLCQKLRKQGIKVLYYVAPQAWAWKSYRAKIIKDCAEILYSILPFEKDWFDIYGVKNIKRVLHPLVRRYGREIQSRIVEIKSNLGIKSHLSQKRNVKIILLPGSRKTEIKSHLLEFKKAVDLLGVEFDLQVGLLQASNLPEQIYQDFVGQKVSTWVDQIFFDNEMPRALGWGDLAIATSGTVTLATALFALPTVVCYKTSLLNEYIFYTFINYKGYMSLPNLIHKKGIFPELRQEQMNSYNIARIIKNWLTDIHNYETIRKELLITYDLMSLECEAPEISMTEVIQKGMCN